MRRRLAQILPRKAGEGDDAEHGGGGRHRFGLRDYADASRGEIEATAAPSTASGGPPPSLHGGGYARRISRAARSLVALGLLVTAAPAHAVEPEEMLKDPALEARARTVSTELRCLVCQNESIDESHAPLAHDIRVLVRQRLEAGDTNQQVVDYLVSRYGQFILLKPPFEPQTLLLWGTPLLVIVAGVTAIAFAARRRPARDPARPLSEVEQRKLDELLGPSV